MPFLTSIRSSLLFISATAIALILWLSISFWHAAYLQRIDARHLLDSMQHDDSLYRLSRSLSEQRSLVQVMLSSMHPATEGDWQLFATIRRAADEQMTALRKTTSHVLEEDALRNRFTFVESEIRSIFSHVVTTYSIVFHDSDMLSAQVMLPLHQRDQTYLDKALLQYNQLIDSIQLLRQGIHYFPRYNTPEIDHLQDLRSTNWQFTDSIAREAALIQVVMASRQLLQEAKKKDIQSLHIKTLATWRTLQQYRTKQGASPELSALIADIEGTYFGDFVELTDIILSVNNSQVVSPMTLGHWLAVETRIAELLNQLDTINSEKIQEVALKLEKSATKNLFIDTLVVLVCLVIGVSVIGLFRKIRHLATHDDLTGLPNRIYFDEVLKLALEAALKQPLAVFFVDLEGFKDVNDSLGQIIGDKLLVAVTQRMQQSIGKRGIIARDGGDEFSILISEFAERDTVFYIANMLHETFETYFDVDGYQLNIGASIGISFYPDDANSADELKRNATIATYHAKAQSTSCICSFEQEFATEYQQRLQIKEDLKRAIAEKQFELAYQPQVGIEEKAVVGLEALIRWNHPERGYIPPDVFISIAENSGQIQEIGDWVLDEACRQMSYWHQNGLPNMQIAVNVSSIQFTNPGFVHFVKLACDQHHLDPSYLELEITESVLLTDVQLVIDTCRQLQQLGIKIAIDDFGTGYSSLSYLQDLPVDTLKIDRAFVTTLDDVTSKSVARTIVMLAKSCGLQTVAEGVETIDQAEMIAELGCDFIQGYYYSKPVAPNELLQRVYSLNMNCQEHLKAA